MQRSLTLSSGFAIVPGLRLSWFWTANFLGALSLRSRDSACSALPIELDQMPRCHLHAWSQSSLYQQGAPAVLLP